MHRLCVILCLCLTGCETGPRTPEEVQRAELPQVRNIRPNLPGNKAVLQLQTETIFLRHDANLDGLWALPTAEGLDTDRIKLLAANGIRIGTVDAVALSQFYAKLPNTGGSRIQAMGVGHEPVVFETTPFLDRAIEIEALLGWDRDETIRLPIGRMQLVLDVVIAADQVRMNVMPHHHWVSGTVTPRTPQEKAMDGRMFSELAWEVDLTGDRYLVIGWVGAEKKQEPKAADMPQVVRVNQDLSPRDAVPTSTQAATPATPSSPVPADAPADAVPPSDDASPDAGPMSPIPEAAKKPKLGEVLLTGQRAGKPLQIICILRVPPQGEAIPPVQARPEK